MHNSNRNNKYVVYHCNATMPLPKRYTYLGNALRKAKKMGAGWFCGSEIAFSKLPHILLCNPAAKK